MNAEAYDILVYGADCTDYESEGLVGPLLCSEAEESAQAGAIPELTITHPIDPYGKWRALCAGNILKCYVHTQSPPHIGNGDRIESTIVTWTVRTTATKPQRALYRSSKGDRKLATLKTGATVVMLKEPADGRVKVRSGKGTGWMERDGLTARTETTQEATGEAIERILGGATILPQLYEIQTVERTDAGVTATAKHIACRLMKNLLTYESPAEITLANCLRGLFAACEDPLGDEWSFQTNLTDKRSGLSWVDVNPLKALLDPEDGVAAKWSCEVIFDNTDIYFLRSAGRDRGNLIEYGANLESINLTEDLTGVATAVKPVGETKDGKPYYLPEVYVVSPNADRYPYRMIHTFKATDCKIGTNGVTAAIAQARMREQAQAILNSGCDTIDLSVEIGIPPQSGPAKLMPAIYDTVKLYSNGLSITSRIVSRKWDALHGRVKGVTIGQIGSSMDSIRLPSWSIGSVSGGKIMPGTIGGSALADGSIDARHVQAESINAEAIAAGSVTTEKLAAGSVTAEKIHAGTIETASLEAVTAKIQNLKATDIQTDTLGAALAAFTVLSAGNATFDAATVQHLVANALNLEFGVGDEVFINNLKVAYAQMVSATIGALCIRASDGNYYTIDVDTDGCVTASPATVTENEINTGQTESGAVILETDIAAASLSTGNLMATYALVNRIDAARIDVDTLLARKAFIDALYTSRIFGGQSLEFIIDSQQNAIQAAQNAANAAVAQVQVQYAYSASNIEAPITGWQATMPEHDSGKYIWQRTLTTYNSGLTDTSVPTCVSGANGEDATVLRIDSSRGTVFKNNRVSTVLSAVIYHGSERITDTTALRQNYGASAYLQWSWQRLDDERFGVISASDVRIGNGGFTLTLSPDDVDTKVTFLCELITN